MRVETRQSYHFGVNFVFAPAPNIDGAHSRRFLEALAQGGLEFTGTSSQPNTFAAQRAQPPLQVQLMQPGPPVGQLAILAPLPARTLEEFIDEAESVVQAFGQVWPGDYQVVNRDSTVRHLYAVESDHAFEYLWERRLGLPSDQLAAFGRPILGGGLRLVVPPDPANDESAGIEVKIESLLADSRKLYVDVQLTWPRPSNARMAPRELLEEVQRIATNEVVAFITGGMTQ
jgi:hypothetical protein